MNKTTILHLITAAKNASPFDVNMAYDAGYDKIIPYIGVTLNEVVGLTQDAIFSRSPSGMKEQALFFGGRDIHLALEMQKEARYSMFKPFEVSTFSDPSGAFTTAAAMLAKVDAFLKTRNDGLRGQQIAIFGASGAVGSTAAMIAARHGAKVMMMAHSDMQTMKNYVDNMKQRYQLELDVVDGSHDAAKKDALERATVCLCVAPAGIQVLAKHHFAGSSSLKVVADVNAVSPTGIEGVDVMANGTPIEGSSIAGFGALAIGRLKYVTQHELLKNMLASDVPVHIDYRDAYEFACAHAK